MRIKKAQLKSCAFFMMKDLPDCGRSGGAENLPPAAFLTRALQILPSIIKI